MTDNQRDHALRVVNHASESIFNRYAAGQAAHGGTLYQKAGLQQEAWAEAIDLVVYLSTLREQLASIYVALEEGRTEAATAALSLLLYGQPATTLPETVVQP